jgi:hypothetical protein
MLKKQILAVVALFIFAATTFADQAAYVSKTQADKAVALLKKQKTVKHYCPPCDDKGIYEEAVKKAYTMPTEVEKTYAVYLREEGEVSDLAYVYFKTKDGKWKNVAKELGIKVTGVPTFLPNKK